MKHEESINVSWGKDTGALIVLRSPKSGGFIMSISNPEHEATCCVVGSNWRKAGLGGISMAGKLVGTQTGKTCKHKKKETFFKCQSLIE